MNHPLKLGGILFLLTALCVGILGGVNQITKPIIEKNEKLAEEAAMRELITTAESFEIEIPNEEGVIKKIAIAKQKNQIVGYVLRTEPNGYGGTIKLLIGIDQEGSIKGINILEHSETPGFGANADKQDFKGQFIERKAPLKVSKNTPSQDEIQAITGATITSAAITEAVNEAAAYVNDHKMEWGNQ